LGDVPAGIVERQRLARIADIAGDAERIFIVERDIAAGGERPQRADGIARLREQRRTRDLAAIAGERAGGDGAAALGNADGVGQAERAGDIDRAVDVERQRIVERQPAGAAICRERADPVRRVVQRGVAADFAGAGGECGRRDLAAAVPSVRPPVPA
jgi:hypothetical protein